MRTRIPTLESARLQLRPFRPADADAVTELINDRAVSATLEGIPHPYRREYAEWWIERHESLFDERRELHLAVVLREPGELVGAVALLSPDQAGQPPQLGYWLGRRHWGRGYASEAVAAIIQYAQRELGERRIAARCMVHNSASVRVLTKLGLRRVGRSPEPVTKGDRTYEVDEYLLEVTDDGPVIRAALASEADVLSELALRSKAHWPYAPEQLEVFRSELVITPDQIAEKRAHVAEEAGAIVGFYTLATRGDGEAELEHLFVDPARLARRLGSRLFRHACNVATSAGARTLLIQSDPYAAGFYRSLGATLVREIPSSIPGRTIPLFTYPLARHDDG